MDAKRARAAQAHALLEQGKFAQALAILQRMAHTPDPDVDSLMALATSRLGRDEQAVFYARRALAAAPGDASKHHNLALMLVNAERHDEAQAAYTRAIELEPTSPLSRLGLGNLFLETSRAAAALAVLGEAMQLTPTSQLAISHVSALMALSDIDEAHDAAVRYAAMYPQEPEVAGMLALVQQYRWGATPQEVWHAHKTYAARVEAGRPYQHQRFKGTRDPGRRLRVGIVSPDLRGHSVAYFAQAFFQHADRAQVEPVVYATSRNADALTAWFKSKAAAWTDAAVMNAMELADQAVADAVDVLVDLSGITHNHRLAAFALRGAPVQVTCIGYPDTTGLSSMDYRIVDNFTDPADAADSSDGRASERLVRLDPCFLCYTPPAAAPAPRVAILQERGHAGMVFGSFNASKKINQRLVGLWARVLARVPESRLVLKASDFRDKSVAQRVLERFAREGVDASRVQILEPTKDLAAHLDTYAQVDIALDTFPYHGTTTTLEALHMGVPVVTLSGVTHASRVGVSLLTNVGLAENITASEDAYIERAANLAAELAHQSPPDRAEARDALRRRLLASPVCDGPAYARRMEQALRSMWRAYCERDGYYS